MTADHLTRFSLFFPEKRPSSENWLRVWHPREAELFSRRIGLDAERNAVPIDVGLRERQDWPLPGWLS
jgi:hypothetical protein